MPALCKSSPVLSGELFSTITTSYSNPVRAREISDTNRTVSVVLLFVGTTTLIFI